MVKRLRSPELDPARSDAHLQRHRLRDPRACWRWPAAIPCLYASMKERRRRGPQPGAGSPCFELPTGAQCGHRREAADRLVATARPSRSGRPSSWLPSSPASSSPRRPHRARHGEIDGSAPMSLARGLVLLSGTRRAAVADPAAGSRRRRDGRALGRHPHPRLCRRHPRRRRHLPPRHPAGRCSGILAFGGAIAALLRARRVSRSRAAATGCCWSASGSWPGPSPNGCRTICARRATTGPACWSRSLSAP